MSITEVIALLSAIITPLLGALVYVHKELMKGEKEKYEGMKEDRDFYRQQAEEKDTTQLEAILALREGIIAVRGIGQDIITVKTQLNILTEKLNAITPQTH